MLLSELLLAHPTLFSRVVFLDVGASVFEWDKNNIKRMMELYSLPTFKGEKDGGGCEEGRGLTNHSVVSSETNLTPRSSSMSRSLSKVALDSVSGKPLRSEQQQQAIRNHLSARYASRYTPSKPRFACFQYFFIHFMQLIVVVFYLLVPKFIARWCLDFFLFGYTRPSYYYDSATYFTPEIERFSRKVNEEIQTTGNTDTLSDKRGWKVVLVAFLRGDGTDSSDNNGYTLRRGYALADVRTPRGVAKDVQKERERLQRLYRHVPSGTTLLDDASDASLNTLSNTGKRSSSIQKRLVYYESYLFPVRKEESPKQQRRRKTPRRMAVRVQVDVAWLHLRNLVGTIMSAVFGGVSRSKETENDKEEKLKRDAMYGLKRDTTEYAVTTKNPPALSTAEQKRFSPLVSQRYFFPIPVPVLFLYGDRKLFFLHSQQWCSYVKDKRNDDGVSDVVRVYGGGHYFFSEERYTERVAKRIIDFIRE
ncbi:hypothetical protein AGDE_14723 [Angomonas deanei]|uniref:Alpha/beta hydrolase family n=1 Tax=Angomonas deanei TaxID=59799 RepID=A0A7G2C1F6_9TRYP|nr:hypothetical protein AGDE_14723 [Angomonas deanei]CAD2213041.1 hypothetical protein, conserved [Angomonas deanei]|eukprot:EPY20352.1 hypothetical protein AGDE_14723 [Angomonas deanei]